MNLESEYISLHKKGFFKGLFCLKYKNQIKSLIDKTNSETLLDYGCGKGLQYSTKNIDKFWGVQVKCYDKYFFPYSFLPQGKFDGVICVEVLEHVPENEIDRVLYEIFQKSSRFVFLSVATKPAKKLFSDGSNVHILLKDERWWNQKINNFRSNQLVEVIFN